MSGLSWFRVDNDVVDHPKVHELAALLKDPNAGWYLIRLWSWTMRYAARGRLQNGAGTALEHACGWRGPSGELLHALLKVGFLDRVVENGTDLLEVHDWSRSQGKAVEKAEHDAERKRAARERRADGAGTARAEAADSALAARVRDETRRDETLRTAAAAAPIVPLPPAPENPYASGSSFFAKLQRDRLAAGFATEKPPRGLDAWFSEVLMELNGDFERVEATVRAWSADPYWRTQRLPTRGLMSQWRQFVPQQAAQPSHQCVICGASASSGWPDIGVPCCHVHANQAAEWCNEQGLEPWVHARQWLERGFRRAI